MRKFYTTMWAQRCSKSFLISSLILLFTLSSNLLDGQTIDLSKPVGSTKMEGGANGTGGVSYSIPIDVLPGINGLVPNLALNYSSQARDGFAGWGWNISGYSSITRAGKNNYYNGIAQPISYTNTNDAFVLDGQRLFATSGNNGANGAIYGSENQGYDKIESFGGTETSGPDWFRVTTKDGKILEFGHADSTKLLSDNGASTLVWLLNKITDRNGNYIQFIYWTNQTDRNYQLMRVLYTGNTASGVQPTNKIEFLYTVKDKWKNSMTYQSGVSIAQPYVLEDINVSNSSGLVKNYHANYAVLKNQLFLTSLTEKGADGTTLNPLKFTYGTNTSTVAATVSPSYGQFNYNNTFTGDVTGDGKDDIIAAYYSEDNNKIRHYKSYVVFDDFIIYAGQPGMSIAYQYNIPNPDDMNKATQVQNPGGYYNFLTMDYDGDTKNDVLMSNWTISGSNMIFKNIQINYSRYYSAISGFTFDSITYPNIPHSSQYTNDFKYAYHSGSTFGTNMIEGDFDGDGAMDYILILGINPSNSFKAFFSSPAKGIINEEIANFGVEGTSSDPFYATSVASATEVVPIDFDGDGKTEILVQKANQSYVLSIFPVSVTSGYNYAATTLYSTTAIKAGYRVFPGDFNGDGNTDLLVRNSKTNPLGAWNILYSTGKLYKSFPFVWHSYPYLENDAQSGLTEAQLLVIGDYNGDGRSDIWQSLDVAIGGGVIQSEHDVYFSNGIPEDGTNSNNAFTLEMTADPHRVNKSVLTNSIVGDINGDSKLDVMSLNNDRSLIIYPQPFKEDHLMASATDGYGSTTNFDYELMNKTGNYDRSYYYYYDVYGAAIGQSANGNPYNVLNVPMYLLTQISKPDGIGGTATTSYAYKDAAFSSIRGFLGFKQVSQTDVTGITNYTQSEITLSVLLPHTIRQFSTFGVDTISDVRITDTLRRLSTNYFDKRYVHETAKTLSINNLTGAAVESTNTYDSYGNVTTNTVKNGYMSGSAITAVETAVTTTTYGTHGTPVPALPESIVSKNTRTGQTQVSKTSTYTYDTKGNILTRTDFSGTANATKATNTYDNFGNVKTVVIAAPNTTTPSVTNTYDNTGRFLTKRQTAGSGITKTETFTYDPKWGNIETSVSSDGLTTSYFYENGFGRLIKTTYPDGNSVTQTLAWESTGNQRYSLTTQRVADGGMYSKDYYDYLGRKIKSEKGGFNNQLLSNVLNYNSIGQLASQTDLHYSNETAVTTTNTYDYYGRPTGSSNGTSAVSITYSKIADGQYKVTNTNGAGQASSRTQDAAGRVIIANDNGGQLNFTYDSWGNQKTVKLGANTVVSNIYDAYGRKTSMTDMNAGTITYEYNALDKITKQTDALNHVYTVSYDAFGRVISHTGSEGTVTYTYFKDATGTKVNDNITNIVGFSGDVTTYVYNSLGEPTSQSTVYGGITFTKAMAYDSYGNLIKTTYPSGVIINDTYDKNSNLTKTTMGSGTTLRTLFTGTALNSKGVYTAYSYGNGKSSTVTYDLVKGVPSRYYTAGIQDLNMIFDGLTGNLTSRKDAIKNLTEIFTFDNLNRLTGSKVNNVQQFTLTYDNTSGTSLGNIKSKSDIGNYVYDNNKINAVKYITSTTGGQTSPGIISQNEQDITYTSFLKPATITENGYNLAYTYGQDQQRIKSVLKQGSTVLETKYYLGAFERQIKGSVTRDIHYINAGNGLCAIIVKQGTIVTPYFVYSDHLGSILTTTDTSGNIVTSQNFDAWGRPRNPNNWTYTSVPTVPDWLYRGYTGHETLSQFSLVNMNGRIYDPTIGRMISPDNYVPMPWSTQGYNRYGYANNNPLSYNDPNGEFLNFLIGGLIGGVINVVSGIITGKIHNFGDGLKYFGVGAVAGALGAGIANGLSASIMNAGSFGSGFMGAVNAVPLGFGNGFVVGAASGFAGGFVGGAGNALMEGQSFGKALSSGLKAGGFGALTGGVAGGVLGGISATKVGRNFWNGQMVVDTKPIGDYVGYSPDAGQVNSADCGPKSVSKMDQEAFGGNLQQSEVRSWQGGDVNADGLKDLPMWKRYAQSYGKDLDVSSKFNPDIIAEHIKDGYKTAFSIGPASQGHEVLLNGMSSQIISRANGSIFMRYVFNIYDPAFGRLINYYKPFNVLNTFYLR